MALRATRISKFGAWTIKRPLTLAALLPAGLILSSLFSSSARADTTAARAPSPGKVRVGVFVRPSDYAALGVDVAKTVAKLKAAGVSNANLMLNDFATARGPTPFKTYSTNRIVEFSKRCRDAGMTVDLTTWVMPHKPFIAGMTGTVAYLLDECDARRLWLDAEEPWTQALDPIDRTEAAAMIADAIPAEHPLALSAIGYAKAELIKPLAKRCEIWSPQAYATTKNKADPAKLISDSLAHWRSAFGKPRGGWVMGLAAYKQPDPPDPAMAKAIEGVLAADIHEVCLWASTSLGYGGRVAKFVRSVSDAP